MELLKDQEPSTPPRILPENELAGNELMNFAAFVKSKWRASDWMWGRLDAVPTLVSILVTHDGLRAWAKNVVGTHPGATDTDLTQRLKEAVVDTPLGAEWRTRFDQGITSQAWERAIAPEGARLRADERGEKIAARVGALVRWAGHTASNVLLGEPKNGLRVEWLFWLPLVVAAIGAVIWVFQQNTSVAAIDAGAGVPAVLLPALFVYFLVSTMRRFWPWSLVLHLAVAGGVVALILLLWRRTLRREVPETWRSC